MASEKSVDPRVPLPAMVLPHNQKPNAPPGCAIAMWVTFAASGVAGFTYEATRGWPTELEWVWWGGIHFPAAWLWGVGAIMGISGILTWVLRRTPPTPSWSVVQYRPEQGGLRLLVATLGSKKPGLLVRPGEHVDLGAKWIRGNPTDSRGRPTNAPRLYSYKIVAPSGAIEFARWAWIEQMSLAPFDEAARPMGITLATHGAATVIARGGV